MSLPEPYFQRDGVALYHGDCRELLPLLPKVDLVLVTDPPYGVNLGSTEGSGNKHGLVRKAYDGFEDTYEFFVSDVVPRLNLAIDACDRAAVFTGPHIQEQRKCSAIGGVYCSAGSGRHSWGFKTFLPVLFYGTAPDLQNGAKPNTLNSNATCDKNGHPCPKPLAWMKWLVKLASLESDTILDPFAGSGTTLRAAMDLGRKAIGIEISKEYCEIAKRRLLQRNLQFAGALE